MSALELNDFDLRVRGELTRAIAERGYAPANAELADRVASSVEATEGALRRLHDSHSLLLHPHRCEPWAVHPFALSPGSCWVETRHAARGWWANCLYCGFGILAAVGEDGCIHTRLGGEREPVVVHVASGEVREAELLFHLPTPVRFWWDNVIHSCASFQPFRSEADVDAWCGRHALPRGAIVPLGQMQRFAADWYGDYLRQPWRKRSAVEIRDLFARHGFDGDFWRVD